MADTLHGIPVQHGWAWVVVIRHWDGAYWFPALFSASTTRAQAIRRFDAVGGDPYAKMRRQKRARALRCRVIPLTFGEDKRREVANG